MEDLMPHSRLRWLVALFLAVSWSLAAVASARGQSYAAFTDPERRFSIDYPKTWNWLVVAGSGESIVVFTEPKREAAIIIQVSRLRQTLSPEDVTDLFARIEAELVKEDRPQAADLSMKVVDEGGRRAAIVDYSRPRLTVTVVPKAPTGDRERVRQYTYPSGRVLYRVTCITGLAGFPKYEAIFASCFKSLVPAATQPAAR